VDHTSGKIYNFKQYMNSTRETLEVPSGWKIWLEMKGLSSKNTTSTMEYSQPMSSKNIVIVIILNIHLVALAQSTKMILPKEI
jgi:hypothetical protein